MRVMQSTRPDWFTSVFGTSQWRPLGYCVKSLIFSRYSCFNLKISTPCPVSVWEFEKTMHCRMSGQRGGDPPPNVDSGFVLDVFERLTPWLDELLLALHRRVLHGCYH